MPSEPVTCNNTTRRQLRHVAQLAQLRLSGATLWKLAQVRRLFDGRRPQ